MIDQLLEKLSRLFVRMENFTFGEMHVSEKSMGNRSVSFFCRLMLWRFAKISNNRAFVRNKIFVSLLLIVYHRHF